jgi:hypothetical protein
MSVNQGKAYIVKAEKQAELGPDSDEQSRRTQYEGQNVNDHINRGYKVERTLSCPPLNYRDMKGLRYGEVRYDPCYPAVDSLIDNKEGIESMNNNKSAEECFKEGLNYLTPYIFPVRVVSDIKDATLTFSTDEGLTHDEFACMLTHRLDHNLDIDNKHLLEAFDIKESEAKKPKLLIHKIYFMEGKSNAKIGFDAKLFSHNSDDPVNLTNQWFQRDGCGPNGKTHCVLFGGGYESYETKCLLSTTPVLNDPEFNRWVNVDKKTFEKDLDECTDKENKDWLKIELVDPEKCQFNPNKASSFIRWVVHTYFTEIKELCDQPVLREQYKEAKKPIVDGQQVEGFTPFDTTSKKRPVMMIFRPAVKELLRLKESQFSVDRYVMVPHNIITKLTPLSGKDGAIAYEKINLDDTQDKHKVNVSIRLRFVYEVFERAEHKTEHIAKPILAVDSDLDKFKALFGDTMDEEKMKLVKMLMQGVSK